MGILRRTPYRALLLMAGCAAPPDPCGGDPICHVVDERLYYALEPEGWDGESPLTTLLWFHAYSDDARSAAARTWFTRPLSELGVLLVLPDGDRTWVHVGSPQSGRDDVGFALDVLEDARSRWPVDPDATLLGGFSQGGSMAWDVACYRPEGFSALVSVAGAFWEPMPERCDLPMPVRHVHGTADTVFPLEGRPMHDFAQGDVRESLGVWERTDACEDAMHREAAEVTVCEVWDECAGDEEVRLCLHPGKHVIPSGWAEETFAWFEARR